MSMKSTARRLVVALFSLACISLAVMWPTWRTVLAQVGGYPGEESSFLGCSTNRAGDFIVVFATGPDTPGGAVGADCATTLNNVAFSGCQIVQEDQSIESKVFGAMFHITCP